MGQEEKNLIFLIFFALFKTKSNIGAGLFYSFFLSIKTMFRDLLSGLDFKDFIG
jgi:hypothetical protein